MENNIDIYDQYPELTRNVTQKKVITARNEALLYPLMVLFDVGAIVLFLLVVIIPKIMNIFCKQGVELPLLSKWLFQLSHFVTNQYPFVLLPFLWFLVFMWQKLRTQSGRVAISRLLLHVPIVRNFEFSSSVAALLVEFEHQKNMGVCVAKAYDRAVAGVPNLYLREELAKFKKPVAAGAGLSVVLSKVPILPKTMLMSMVASENTGKSKELNDALAEIYSERAIQDSKNLCSVVEPTFILLLGLSVGTMVIACYLPIFKAVHAVSGS